MFRRLIKLIREEKVSLFIGSGFSLEAGAPSVGRLKEIMLSDFEDDAQRESHQYDNLQELSEFYVEEVCAGSRQKLIADMKEVFSFNPTCMLDHKLLAAIPHFHHVFTTNYDTLLEDSYDKDDVQVVRKDQDLSTLDEKKYVTVYKIHGDFQDNDSVIITKSDYGALLNKNNRRNDLIWRVVESEFAKKHILFVGYSLEDDNILDIIRYVVKRLNKNHKQIFLLAPSIGQNRQNELRKMHVTYIESFATPFLEELTKEILIHSHEDFKNKKLSPEAFSRVCNMHGFDTNISLPKKGKNEIKGIYALPGNKLHQQINFTVDKDVVKQLLAGDFEKYGTLAPGLPMSGIPCIKVPGSSLIKSNYIVNGVALESNFASLFVYPCVHKKNITIRIPSRDFFETVECSGYKLNNKKIVLQFDCGLYETKITVITKSQVNGEAAFTANFNFDFHPTYSDNGKALLWINFIDAAFQHELFEIKELTPTPFNIDSSLMNKKSYQFAAMKTYYEDIKKIEMYLGKKFKTYNAYSEELAADASMIRSYFTHTPINIACKNGLGFTARVDEASEFAQTIEVSKRLCMVIGDENVKFEINDEVFVIPYIYRILNNSEIQKIKPQNDGNVLVGIFYPSDKYIMLLADKPANQEFKGLDSTMGNLDLKYVSSKKQ